jgi:hypothetical protein
LQIGHSDIRSKLPGEEITGDKAHGQQQQDRNHSNENVGNDQAVAQSPHELAANPAQNQERSAEKKNEDQEVGPSAEKTARRGAQNEPEHLQRRCQITEPERGLCQLRLGAKHASRQGAEFVRVGQRKRHHKAAPAISYRTGGGCGAARFDRTIALALIDG